MLGLVSYVLRCSHWRSHWATATKWEAAHWLSGRSEAARCARPFHAAAPRRLSTPQNIGEATPPGVELLLDELGTRVAVAFADAADARQWLGLWCSACTA